MESTGARIVGDVDLENAKLIRAIAIFGSRIEGEISLRRARTDSLISLDGSLMTGEFTADSLHSESDLFVRNGAVFKSEVSLNGAKIDGGVEMTGASFDGTLDASHLQVGGYLLMNSDDQNKASFKDVDLTDTKVAGQLNMIGASFDGPLNADIPAGRVAICSCAMLYCIDEVIMDFAHVGGNLDLARRHSGPVSISRARQLPRSLQLGEPDKSTVWTGSMGTEP